MSHQCKFRYTWLAIGWHRRRRGCARASSGWTLAWPLMLVPRVLMLLPQPYLGLGMYLILYLSAVYLGIVSDIVIPGESNGVVTRELAQDCLHTAMCDIIKHNNEGNAPRQRTKCDHLCLYVISALDKSPCPRWLHKLLPFKSEITLDLCTIIIIFFLRPISTTRCHGSSSPGGWTWRSHLLGSLQVRKQSTL